MNIYVAGRTKDIENVRTVQAVVMAKGHHITFDWTDPEYGDIRSDWSNAIAAARSHASIEREAVRQSDCVILVWHEHGGLGALFETGMAMAYSKRVIVVGTPRESVFWYLQNVERVKDMHELESVL